MQFRLKFLPLVALVVAIMAAPSAAGAEDFPEPEYLGGNFSINSNGWQGSKTALVEDLKKDQSACADWASEWLGVWSKAQASKLADQPHAGAMHRQCVADVQKVLPNLRFRMDQLGNTRLWRERNGKTAKQRKQNRKRCKKSCVFVVPGRDGDGKWTLKKVRRSKHRRVLVVEVKKAFHLKGKLRKVGEPFGIGEHGCTNRMGQRYEEIKPIRFKLRLKYFEAARAKKKGKVPGPGGGQVLPPAPDPLTPPDNDNNPTPTTPPPSIPPGSGPPGNGGKCTDSRGEPIACT